MAKIVPYQGVEHVVQQVEATVGVEGDLRINNGLPKRMDLSRNQENSVSCLHVIKFPPFRPV